MADGRTGIINSCETCFPSHIRVLSKRIKRGYGIENASRAIPSHIRVLSKRIKRAYGIENAFRGIPSHIRVLSKRIKRGYSIENAFRAIPSHMVPYRDLLGDRRTAMPFQFQSTAISELQQPKARRA